ncbi:Rpn family recombination-promoting nuclease/putative transposase [Cohnella silvisoli]|uniref:Rpn family recombination-promoting nuclease/putative transposase n=1 Tax=Cohnella silvisoli TaxID=2873699 RepID=A0ABV1KWW2_9BACL|nr:Rpn family recombination-promoting nuclease/putative transposase [Cohnella silvisoli]MCD9023808.1 Rpn family recombination-promoting nuclease/putative transposase [Cohnella silvisoli]
MIAHRLKPKNDFLFKRLFGENESKHLLIALLNAILHPVDEKKIVNVTVIENKELVKEVIDGKSGRLDVRCETADQEQIDLEVQIEREHAMDKRTLFYLGKMYVSSIKEGHDYELLKKTVAINILDFSYLPLTQFHSTFHLYEDTTRDFMLTDVLEVHFLECPKFRSTKHDLNNPLHRWLLFLDEKVTKQQLEELIAMDSTIKSAEERLLRLSSDEETLRLYEAREEALIEHNSAMSAAKRSGMKKGIEEGERIGLQIGLQKGIQEGLQKGIQEGLQKGIQEGLQKGIQEGLQEGLREGKLETAKNLLSLGINIEMIEKATGLSRAEFLK